jgi:glucokinase
VILAGDVGATKILLEAGDFRSERWAPLLARRYLIADFPNFYAVIAAFLEEWNAVKPARARLSAVGVGIAGPVQGDKVKMTHRPWTIDGAAVTRRSRIPKAILLNDLAAAANGIEAISSRDLVTIQPGKADPESPRAVLGVGTGLGVAYLVPRDGRYEVVPGEGGHVGFSPGSAPQAHLWEGLFRQHGRVEAEMICSGMGISNVYQVLKGERERREPAWVSENAAQGDDACTAALDLVSECLGNVAGDHALAVMARGGVYLAGGVVARIAPVFNAQRFREAFCAKGAFSSVLMKIPVRLVTNERLALIGAARAANSL